MKILGAVEGFLSSIERALLVVMLTAMIVLAFTQIILRDFFSTSFLWADPLLRHLVLWTGFFGAGIAAREERHIHLDFVNRLFSSRAAHVVRIFVSLFAAITCAFLTNAAWTFLLSEKDAGDELFNAHGISFQTWWFQTIIPAGFVLLAIHFLIKMFEHVSQGLVKNPGYPEAAQAPDVPLPNLPPRPEA